MPLQKQTVSVPFNQGVDTKTDPKQIQMGKLAVLQNGVFNSTNRLEKRPGNQALPLQAYVGTGSGIFTGYVLSKSYGLNQFKNELTQIDQKYFFSFDETNQTWWGKGNFDANTLSIESIVKNNDNHFIPDVAYSPLGLECWVWNDASSGGSKYALIDSVTRNTLFTGVLSGTAENSHVEYMSGAFWLVYGDTGSTNISYAKILDTSPNGNIAATGTIATDQSSTSLAISTSVINGNLYVAYSTSANLVCRIITPAGSVGAANTIKAGLTVYFSFFGDASNNVWFTYTQSTTWYAVIYNTTLTATVLTEQTLAASITTPKNVCGIYWPTATQNYGYFFLDYVGSGGDRSIVCQGFTVNKSSSFGILVARHVGILSKPYGNGTNVYLPVGFPSDPLVQQDTCFVLLIDPSTAFYPAPSGVVAKFASGGLGLLPLPSFMPSSRQIGNNYLIPYLELGLDFKIATQPSQQNGISAALMTHGVTPQSVEIGNNLHLTGGQLWSYDGVTIAEQNFHLFPEVLNVVGSTSGGAIAAGTYIYYLTWEWTDNFGQVHQSTPSLPETIVTTGTTSSVIFTVNILSMTRKPYGSVRLALWRSFANSTSGIVYRCSPADGPVYSASTVSITITDTSNDTDLQSNSQLYTAGGVVENGAAPASIALCTYKNRLVSIPADSRLSFWYSKQVIPGSPVEFSPFFTFNVDATGGDLTVCQQMDDKLILGKRLNFFYLVGDGPTPTGANNDFAEAQLIAVDCGCVSALSMVLMPEGCMFQSTKGIYLLSRGLTDQYIGADVEGYNSLPVLSVTLMSGDNHVRFLVGSASLVYDYYYSQWSVFTGYTGIDSAYFQDQFTQIFSSGLVWQENPALFNDAGAFIPLQMETAWISFAGLQGFQRVYKALILGEFKSNHSLNINISYDFETSVSQNDVIPVTGALAAPYQFRVLMNRQKTQSVKINIVDSETPAYAEGYNISALGFELGTKGGLKRLPAAQTYG